MLTNLVFSKVGLGLIGCMGLGFKFMVVLAGLRIKALGPKGFMAFGFRGYGFKVILGLKHYQFLPAADWAL